jgi:DsbC/DsbD-like thiol-disulfide interchange protein
MIEPMTKTSAMRALLLALLFQPGNPALASGWVDAEGAAMRVITAPADASGTVRGIVEITLEPGWKTYWRDPGDGGIPPSLTEASSGAPVPLAFPVPERISESGMQFLGYHAGVAFPFSLQDPQPGMRLEAFVGVCRDICVPFSAVFAVEPKARNADRIDRAFASLPADAGDGRGIIEVVLKDGVAEFTIHGNAQALHVAPDQGLVLARPEATATGFSSAVLRDDGKAGRVFFTLVRPDGAFSGHAVLAR